MIQRHVALALAFTGMCLAAARPSSASINNADYTTQIEAADVLSRFLTNLNTSADARFQAMSAFLRETGASRAYTQQRKPPERPKSEDFDHVFLGAIQFIKDGGEQYANPELPRLETPRLVAELRVLQSYNIQQFLALDLQQKELHAMTAFLESTDRMPAYRQWASKKNMDTPPPQLAQLPPAADAESFAKEMKNRLDGARAQAWREAQAGGITAAQFDQQWTRQQQQQKRLIGYRLAAIRTAAQQPPEIPAPAPARASASNPPPAASAMTYDPRWDPYYYGPTDSWNGWDQNDGDAFSFRSGSGTYRRYDQRLNRAFDLRLNGTYDRRVDVDNDRRLNVHEDPRESF